MAAQKKIQLTLPMIKLIHTLQFHPTTAANYA